MRHSKDVKIKSRELFLSGRTTGDISRLMGINIATVSTWVSDLYDEVNFKGKKFGYTRNGYEVRGDITCIFVKYKGTIMESLIDTDDFDKIYRTGCTWYVVKNSTNLYVNGQFYVKKGERKSIHLHKFILDENKQVSLDIDHINHDSLDNRKCNLRFVTKAENLQNMKGAHKDNKTGIRGVSKHPSVGYMARLCVNRKSTEKWFKTIEEASEWVSIKRKELMPFACNY